MIKSFLTKFHYHLGLFLLVYLWLFSLTGLFLNHPNWSVNDYRKESQWIDKTASVTPAGSSDLLKNAENYLEQLDLKGEVSNLRAEENLFRFNVRKPGIEVRLTIDTNKGDVQLREKKTDNYGALNTLHIFNGMQRFDPKKEHLTWYATKLWVIAMDGLAIGIIILIFTGFYIWLKTKKNLISGTVCLLLGTILAIMFLYL